MLDRKFTPEEMYRRVGRLIETVPTFGGIAPLTPDQLTWLGRAEALVKVTNDIRSTSDLMVAAKGISVPTTRPAAFQAIMMVLYRVLAAAELYAPAGAQGAFIPVGSSFDAYSAVSKILSSAVSDVLIVDPYMDDTILLDFGGAVPQTVRLRLLTDAATVKPSLIPAASRWKIQYAQTTLDVRVSPAKTLHDRAIFIDGKEAWTITQSLKDLAKRSPAEIVRADDTASLKIVAYEQLWCGGQVLV